MTKLLILDKDGTLVKPKSGGTFVQSPDDQELLPGVAEKLAAMREDGWAIAIASNQGGCDTCFVAAQNAKPGMLLYNSGLFRKICSVDAVGDGGIYQVKLNDGDIYEVTGKTPLSVAYKSIDDAIAEMKYAMELTGINIAFFCPDMEGEQCIWVDRENSEGAIEVRDLKESNIIDGGKCRKPDPGMLIVARSLQIWREEDLIEIDGVQSWKPDTCLMVGDRPEDEQAAKAAGFEFQWASEFFGGGGNG